jgi:hypothetical protein
MGVEEHQQCVLGDNGQSDRSYTYCKIRLDVAGLLNDSIEVPVCRAQVQVFTRRCQMGGNARAEISLPDFSATFAIERVKDSGDATEENAITRHGWTSAPHKLSSGKPAVKRPVQSPRFRIEAEQLVAYRDHVCIRAEAEDVRRRSTIAREAASYRVFPDDLPCFSLKGVYVTCFPISPNKDQVISNKRVAVETCLLPVLFDVVAPPLLPVLSVECVKGAGARADVY